MEEKNDNENAYSFINNLKNPSSQPFKREKLMIMFSLIILLTGMINFLDSIQYFDVVFNPNSYILSLAQEQNLNFSSYSVYIKKIDQNKTILDLNITQLLSEIIISVNKTEEIKKISDQIYLIEEKKNDILGDITNFAILSIFLIISSILTFSLRNYTGDWKKDMNIYFIREAFGNTASLASLAFWFSIHLKTKFSRLVFHNILHNIGIIFNISTNFANLFLFIVSFNDYFEFKEKNDFDEMMENKRGKPDDENEKKNN